jgi:LmbE family N-acetylglucosaminyl deacetylase
MNLTTWIYLSPHPDDVALSCGGLVWEQVGAGAQVEIWTICAADPPPGELSPFAQTLHARWETGSDAFKQRRLEDQVSCQALGAGWRHFQLSDCIYRRSSQDIPLYASNEAIMGTLHPEESSLIDRLAAQIAGGIPDGAQLVSPLAIGGHVDHRLTRAAAEHTGLGLVYYADYPYVQWRPQAIDDLLGQQWFGELFPVSPPALEAWQASIAAHRSQISSFWPDLPAMQADIEAYCRRWQGVKLWQAPG